MAAVRMAVKRARKSGDNEDGYKGLLEWTRKHPNGDINAVLKCYRKWIKEKNKGVVKSGMEVRDGE